MCPYSELFWSAFFPHFSAFGPNTGRYSVSLQIQSRCGKCGKNADQNNSEYEHFLRSVLQMLVRWKHIPNNVIILSRAEEVFLGPDYCFLGSHVVSLLGSRGLCGHVFMACLVLRHCSGTLQGCFIVFQGFREKAV